MTRSIAAMLLVWLASAVTPQEVSAITIDTVPIGNIGNGNDPATGGIYGGVGYGYRIGTTEVTVGQYTTFLNAVAKTDTYFLYDDSMGNNDTIAGISRSGVPGSYSYAVVGSPTKPVAYVTWGDAARFTNWLHNGQPAGLQNASTTEDGAYALNGALSDAALNAANRKAGAQWFIPTENEWYKSAYHQPASQGGDADGFWEYPTQTNSEPNSDQPPGEPSIQTNVANFLRDDSLANGFNDGYAVTGSPAPHNPSGGQNYLTDVGAYLYSTSFYGTFDQGGNVQEWTEGLVNNGNNRVLRGGSWVDPSVSSSYWLAEDPSNPFHYIGFRVATVPEPCSLVLAVLAVISHIIFARRK